ncbi:MAG TPA: hypothetical protein VE911_02455 [Candidatus Nitrosopolaris sp.]|nr:hypothetical protein [Candidatus Nitrosopolaris sp.]
MADWTPGERCVLEIVTQTHSWEWVERNAERLLDEARSVEGEDLEGLDGPLGPFD